MTAKEFLLSLEARGVHLWQDASGKIWKRAPRGVITPAVAARIKAAEPRIRPLLPVEGPPLTPKETEDFRKMWEEAEPPMSQELYGQIIRAAHQAALTDQMPVCRLTLRGGRRITSPNTEFLALVEQGKGLRAEHGEDWMSYRDGDTCAHDINLIAYWWYEKQSPNG